MKYILIAAFSLALAGAAGAQGSNVSSPGLSVPGSNYTLREVTDPNFQDKLNAMNAASQRFRESASPPQQKEAAAMLASTSVTCDMADAGLVMNAKRNATTTLSYEVACKDDFGWIVTRINDQITAYDCIALAASAQAASRSRSGSVMSTCRLRSNVGNMAGPQALVNKVGAKCTVAQATYLGGGGSPPIGRYEVACKEGGGYVIDKPQPKSQARLLAAACSADPKSPLPCTLHGKKS